MMKYLFGLFVFILNFSVFANEHIKLQPGEDIVFEVKTNLERQAVFPEPVRMASKAYHKSLFTFSLIGNSFYVTSKKVFSERLVFQGLKTNTDYVVMLISTPDTLKSGKLIIHDKQASKSENKYESTNLVFDQQKVTVDALVQFAAQSIYPAADGLIEPIEGIRKAAFSKEYYPNIYSTGVLKGQVLAAWVGHGYYITALKLTNRTSSMQVFDPCKLRGDFHSSTPIFSKIGMKEDERNNFTAVIILSEKPFDNAANERVKLCR